MTGISTEHTRKFFITGRSGTVLDFEAPTTESINFGDIALALSRIPHFAGQTSDDIEWGISLAQHSNLVSTSVGRRLGDSVLRVTRARAEMVGLLHDAHEAYTNDIPSGLKALLKRDKTIVTIQSGIDRAIFARAGLGEVPDWMRTLVKEEDLRVLASEWKYLMPADKPCPFDAIPVPGLVLSSDTILRPRDARKAFLARLLTLRRLV